MAPEVKHPDLPLYSFDRLIPLAKARVALEGLPDNSSNLMRAVRKIRQEEIDKWTRDMREQTWAARDKLPPGAELPVVVPHQQVYRPQPYSRPMDAAEAMIEINKTLKKGVKNERSGDSGKFD